MCARAAASIISIGSRVKITSGRRRGTCHEVIGETADFWRVQDQDKVVHRVKKSNVHPIPDEEESEAHTQSQAAATLLAGGGADAGPEPGPGPGYDDQVINPASAPELESSTPSSSSSESLAPEPPQRQEAVLRSHTLRIASWNTCKLAFLGQQQEVELAELLRDVAQSIAAAGIEVVALQEVPKKLGPARIRALRERLNEALVAEGVDAACLFEEPVYSGQTEGSREIHALLLRPPVKLERAETLVNSGNTSFKYPPLLALLRDDRFSFSVSRQIVLTSVHTPGSQDGESCLQRAKEVNQLLSGLQAEAPVRLCAKTLRFSDKRMRRKVDSREACAAPFVLCGDLNTDFFKKHCGVKEEAREAFHHDLKITPMQGMPLAVVETSNGTWVAGAPPGRVTSSGGKCLDFFMWNASVSKQRMGFIVRPLHLSLDAVKRARHRGLSDHDLAFLEMHEDNLHSFQERAAMVGPGENAQEAIAVT